MIMIHSSHQALLGQFLSSKTNTRTDEYGGSLENRMRYPFEEIHAIRESVGEKMLFLKCVSAYVKRLLADPKMSHNALTEKLQKLYPLSTYVIGDCTAKGGTIKRANMEALNVAISI